MNKDNSEKNKNLFLLKICSIFNSICYIGKIPGPKGTYGSLIAIPFVYFLCQTLDLSASRIVIIIIIITIVASLTIAYNNRFSFNKDLPEIVIDEFVAFSFLLSLIPFNYITWLLAFILFRFFDISKIAFIKKIDRLSAKFSFAVILDDLIAAVYSYLIIIFITSLK